MQDSHCIAKVTAVTLPEGVQSLAFSVCSQSDSTYTVRGQRVSSLTLSLHLPNLCNEVAKKPPTVNTLLPSPVRASNNCSPMLTRSVTQHVPGHTAALLVALQFDETLTFMQQLEVSSVALTPWRAGVLVVFADDHTLCAHPIKPVSTVLN